MTTTSESTTPMTILKAIDHPSQPSWQSEGSLIPTAMQLDAISDRYQRTDSAYLNKIITTVGIASTRSDGYRGLHETTTLGILGLKKFRNSSPYDVLTADQSQLKDELDNYTSLAARPDKILDFISWFAKKGAAYYAANPDSSYNKLGIELGGKRQGGDWENTEPVDSMIRAIPDQFKALPDSSIRILDSPEERLVAYRFELLDDQFGLLRRRRAVADLALNIDLKNNLLPARMRLFKESLFMLVLDCIPMDLREEIKDDIEKDVQKNIDTNQHQSDDSDEKEAPPIVRRNSIAPGDAEGLNNTPAALIAGNVTKRASQAPENSSNDVIPISAHYVLLMDKPSLK